MCVWVCLFVVHGFYLVASICASASAVVCPVVVFYLTYMRSRRAYRFQHNQAQHSGSCHAQASLKPHFGILSHHAKLSQISVNDGCISQERITSREGEQMQLVSRGKVQGELVPPQLVSECVSVCVCVCNTRGACKRYKRHKERERARILVTILVRFATLTLIPKVVPTCACRKVSRRLEIAYICNSNQIQFDLQQYPN